LVLVAPAHGARGSAFFVRRIEHFMAGDNQACPKCGGKEVQPAGILRRHVNPWAMFLGGWVLSLLWSGSRKEEVRCVGCDTIFQRPTRASRVAWVLLIVFILLVLLGLWAQLSGAGLGDGK
jgi:hypothetical protein